MYYVIPDYIRTDHNQNTYILYTSIDRYIVRKFVFLFNYPF